ncbi:DUF523 domain-containing protein [bacterium]|nr:DUF523 domain-containing protein [bacterium]
MKKECIIVSACLVGITCRYDGDTRTDKRVTALSEKFTLIPVCPEQLGGMETPRPASIIECGDGFDVIQGRAKVVSELGKDVTENFIKGAEEALKAAKMSDAVRIILKERSPSCGVHQIYRGTEVTEGCGVTCALLKREGFKVESNEDL